MPRLYLSAVPVIIVIFYWNLVITCWFVNHQFPIIMGNLVNPKMEVVNLVFHCVKDQLLFVFSIKTPNKITRLNHSHDKRMKTAQYIEYFQFDNYLILSMSVLRIQLRYSVFTIHSKVCRKKISTQPSWLKIDSLWTRKNDKPP